MSTTGSRDVSISALSRDQIQRQGTLRFSDAKLATHRSGLRFAYPMCFTATRIGIVFHRTVQERFACAIATVWLAVTIYLFTAGWAVAGTILGGLLFWSPLAWLASSMSVSRQRSISWSASGGCIPPVAVPTRDRPNE
jgi:hypothetical protein